MLKIFFENRLVYQYRDREAFQDEEKMKDNLAESINKGAINDSKTAENINNRIRELRSDLHNSSIISEEDKKSWKGKLNVLESHPDEQSLRRLEEEFSIEKRAIRGMVDKYTQKVLDNKKEAFTVDKSRDLDTAQQYLDWFSKLSKAEMEKALNKIDQDINERIKLREKIIEKNPDLKKDVVKMRRSEMLDKLKELERIETNVQKARKLLERDKKYSSGIEFQLKHFADHTPEEQEQYLLGYEKYYLKPRKDVMDKYESVPAEVKKHPKLPDNLKTDFYKLQLKEKQKFMEKMEEFIEDEFMKEVNAVPEKTWSNATKRFAQRSFEALKTIKDKGERLHRLPDFIKTEQNLTNAYFRFPADVQQMPDYSIFKWEKANFEDKRKMLEQMAIDETLLSTLKSLLSNRLKQKIISQSTYEMYLKSYIESTTRERTDAFKNFDPYMAPREKLLSDFNDLSEEAKNHYQTEFLMHGYQNRLKIFNQAKTFQDKNTEKTKSGEKNDLTITDKANEKQTATENKVKTEIKEENKKPTLNAQEKEELENLQIAEEVIEDQKEVVAKEGGKEKLADQNKQFGEAKFTRDLNKRIVVRSGGKKMLGKDGKVDYIEQIDITRFGQTDKDQRFRVAKKMREMAQDDNFRESQIKDQNGTILTTKETQSKFTQRKDALIRRLSFRKKLDNKKAGRLIEDEFKKSA